MATLYIIGLIFIGYSLCTFLIVTTHELGHALAYLILTKPDEIIINIGSQEKPKKALRFKLGKLHFNIIGKAFITCCGSCSSSEYEFNYKKEIFILLAGNLLTLFLSFILLFAAFGLDWHGGIKLFSIVLLVYALIIAYYNLLSNNGRANTDGRLIISTIKLSKVYNYYSEGRKAFGKNDFSDAINHFEIANNRYPDEINILRPLFISYCALRDIENALKIYHQFKNQPNLTEHDLISLGYINSITRDSETAIGYYNQALSYPATYRFASLNLAFEMIIAGQYTLADKKLLKLISDMPDDFNPYGYLGYSKIMQNELEEGKALIDKCFEYGGDDNAYMYKALGIYYMKIDDLTKARENFDKAKKLDSWVDVDDYITQLSD
ncbi:hypothetical protein LJ707_13675 [Mucilaginibacter sp. UR6-1]|uniref:tetratricopeptide repeat protein n=1 Tax=Mucilaginibacter sp. UR6-1 TaxID=1435643 RepID=UPI001E5940ED|nr:hypothetical protein [Mucilaginibacter sp. UR6-1]MCC8409982.1 hypothetical protein [Mucilaginibacter sp. UR6-1]